MFEKVINLESNMAEKNYTFNSIKYIVLITMQLGSFTKMIDAQKKMLAMSNVVSKNDLSEAIQNVQDMIQSKLTQNPIESKAMYELILSNLKTSNERLWFATCCRLAKIYLDDKNYGQMDQLL